MTRPHTIGVNLLPPAEPSGLERAQWAEAQGFHSVWIPDGDGKMHALTLAGAIAATTRRIVIGTGIVPVYTHTPAVLAASATALAHLAPGRIRLGLGASSATMMAQWNGIPFAKPLTRVRETTQVLRRMLAGERVDFQGKTLGTRGFRLNPPPAEPVPIYLAALRPKMLELAGELADGVILNLVPLHRLPAMLQHVAAGAARAGRSLAEIDVVCRYNTVVSDDRPAALEDLRAFVGRYFAAPVYNAYFEWCGYGEEARRYREGFAKGDRAATAAALTDAMLAELGVVGTEDECRGQLRAFAAAGVTTSVIVPLDRTAAGAERTFAAYRPGDW